MLKKLGLCALALSVPASAFAEGGSITIDSNLSSIDVAGAIGTLGATLATGIIAALGLAIGCWGVMLLWKKVRGAIK